MTIELEMPDEKFELLEYICKIKEFVDFKTYINHIIKEHIDYHIIYQKYIDAIKIYIYIHI
jgi:hypothetical protein